jgi:hypothetical protein
MMMKKDESDVNERAAGSICTRDACVVTLNGFAGLGVSQWQTVVDESSPIKKLEFPAG